MHHKEPKNDGLFIPTRHVGFLIVILAFVGFGIFMSGYFLGKKQVMDELIYKIEQESLADQLYSSLCQLYDHADDTASTSENNASETSTDPDDQESDTVAENQEAEQPIPVMQTRAAEPMIAAPCYYAQLIGFATKQAAEHFVQRIATYASVEIREKQTTNAKGRRVVWYQVVTKPFTDKTALQGMVDRITKQEKLKGVYISTC